MRREQGQQRREADVEIPDSVVRTVLIGISSFWIILYTSSPLFWMTPIFRTLRNIPIAETGKTFQLDGIDDMDSIVFVMSNLFAERFIAV